MVDQSYGEAELIEILKNNNDDRKSEFLIQALDVARKAGKVCLEINIFSYFALPTC